MTKRTIVICILLLAVLTAPQALLAQAGSGSNRDWAAVMTVQPGEKLGIKLKNGKTVEGKLSSVSETGLALASGSKTAEIRREDAQQVYRIAGASTGKPTLIGAAIGAAGGAGLGATAGDCRPGDFFCFDRSKTVPVGAAVGAGVGALIGFSIGKARHKRTLIYEA
jgi:hypothetical protein